jgi:uncharacterized protein
MTSTAPFPDVMAPYSVAKVAGRYLVVNTLGNWALFEPDAYHRLLRGTLSPSAVRTLVDEGVLRDRARPVFTKNHVLESLRPHCGGPSLHVIALGAGCNLHCVYCRTSVMRAASPAGDPTPDELRRIVDFALSFPLKQQMLEFGVGEPTLRNDTLLDVIAYAERVAEHRGKQVSFRLTTNGTHLDDATLDRLVAHGVHISVSLDGPADLHDRQRPRTDGQQGSFVPAAGCIADLCRNRHYPRVSASTTVTGWNVGHLDEIIDLYVDLGVERVALRPVVAQGAAKSGGTDLLVRSEALKRAVPRALARMVELGASGTRLQEAYLSFYCQQVFGTRRGMTEAMSPCGFGIAQLAYSPDGRIFGCEEYMSAGLPALGHVARDTPATIVHHSTVREVLEKSFLDDLACPSCAFIPYCGQCPAVAKLHTGSYLPMKSLTFRCTMTEAYLRFIFERAAIDDPALRGYCERYGHGWTQALDGGLMTSRRW